MNLPRFVVLPRTAARRVFSAGLQRCRVHWARNLLRHAAPKQRAAVAAMIRTIFAHYSKAEAFTPVVQGGRRATRQARQAGYFDGRLA